MFLRIEGFQVGFEIGLSLVGDVWASWASGPPRSSGPPYAFKTRGPPRPPQC